MAKKKKVKTVAIRPKTSPYTSSPTAVYFGVNRQRYYVQEDLLQKLENLPSRHPWASDLALTDVDADSGHVLIHFLHTGTYQTLDTTNDEQSKFNEKELLTSEFQRSVRAFEVANRYASSGLQPLAKAEMERWGAEMSLHDAIQAISDESVAIYLDQNVWLQDFVSQKVRSAFQLNPEAFSGRDFFEGISSHALTKILARDVVSLYKERVADLQKEEIADGKPPPSDDTSNWTDPHARQATSEHPVPNQRALLETKIRVESINDSGSTNDSNVLDLERASTPATLSMKAKASSAMEDERLEKASLLQNIADLAVDEKTAEPLVSISTHANVTLAEPEAITATAVTDNVGGEKKQDQLEWSDWGFAKTSSKKDEKTKKKSKKKGSDCISDIPVLAAARERPQPEQSVENQLPKSPPRPNIKCELLCIEKEEDGWGDWGAINMKDKKAKKHASPESSTIGPEPASGPDISKLKALVESEDDARLIKQATKTPKDDDCPWRQVHLYESDGWKICKPCQSHMRKMASKLQVAGL